MRYVTAILLRASFEPDRFEWESRCGSQSNVNPSLVNKKIALQSQIDDDGIGLRFRVIATPSLPNQILGDSAVDGNQPPPSGTTALQLPRDGNQIW